MPNVLFVAPFFLPTTLRFVEAIADLPGVRLGLISQDPAERLPPGLRGKLAAHWRIDDGLSAGEIAAAASALSEKLGPIHRLIGALEELQVPLALARAKLGLEGMGVEEARNFRDKARMKTVLRDAGIPCARHKLATCDRDAQEFAAAVGYPLVVKPPAGAGAKNTFRVDGNDALRETLEMMPPSTDRPVLYEEFIVGEEHSFDSVWIRGQMVWHSLTRYLPGPLDVLRNPWIQWCVLLPREVDHPRYDDIRAAAVPALQALGMETGLCHMEWFRRKDGSVAISEVGARPPGAQIVTITSYAHDFDLYRAWARLMVFEEFTAPARRYAVGASFLRGQGEGRVVRILGLDQAQKELGALVVEVKLPKPGQFPASSYEGEGYVILRHEETAVVEKALHRLVSLVRVELG